MSYNLPRSPQRALFIGVPFYDQYNRIHPYLTHHREFLVGECLWASLWREDAREIGLGSQRLGLHIGICIRAPRFQSTSLTPASPMVWFPLGNEPYLLPPRRTMSSPQSQYTFTIGTRPQDHRTTGGTEMQKHPR